MISNDADALDVQYGTSDRLRTRSSVWRDTPDGRNPRRAALAAVLKEAPQCFLEIGCGTGEFAQQVQQELPESFVLATDRSEAMALEAARRGVAAQVVDVVNLPFDDHSFEAVYGWMLYHVSDLATALAQVRRVLRPGGLFVAVTNGDEHLADFLRDAGGEPLRSEFSSENGQAALARHFNSIEREDFDTRAVFDHASAQAYLATLGDTLQIPPFDGERTYRGATTMFLAR